MIGGSDGTMVSLLGQILSALQQMTTAINDLKNTIIENDSELKQAIITEGNETQEVIADLKTNEVDVAVTVPVLANNQAEIDTITIGIDATKNYNVSILNGFNAPIITTYSLSGNELTYSFENPSDIPTTERVVTFRFKQVI
jgi:hypothetical protein